MEKKNTTINISILISLVYDTAHLLVSIDEDAVYEHHNCRLKWILEIIKSHSVKYKALEIAREMKDNISRTINGLSIDDRNYVIRQMRQYFNEL